MEIAGILILALIAGAAYYIAKRRTEKKGGGPGTGRNKDAHDADEF